MLQYYKTLLGRQQVPKDAVDLEIIMQGPTMSIKQQLGLTTPFSDREIKEVIYSIPDMKSRALMAIIVVSSRPFGSK